MERAMRQKTKSTSRPFLRPFAIEKRRSESYASLALMDDETI